MCFWSLPAFNCYDLKFSVNQSHLPLFFLKRNYFGKKTPPYASKYTKQNPNMYSVPTIPFYQIFNSLNTEVPFYI